MSDHDYGFTVSSSLQICILYANERLAKAATPECNGMPLLMTGERQFEVKTDFRRGPDW